MEAAVRESRMKRALRSCETEMFFKQDATQTQSIEEAQEFQNVEEATAFSKRHRLRKAELVLRDRYPEQDVRIPIQETFPKPTAAKRVRRESKPAARSESAAAPQQPDPFSLNG